MEIPFRDLLPHEIEAKSMEIIESELRTAIDPKIKPIVKRVIHTTADFSYEENLYFSPHVIDEAFKAIKGGVTFVTDTNMAMAGVNKKRLEALGCSVRCFMADEDVLQAAENNGTTRAAACMDKGARLAGPLAFVIGNAPTALIRLHHLIKEERLRPAFIVAAPVGFVNVVESKELIKSVEIPCIIAMGRKGGSNVAAAICNSLLYMME